MFGSQATGQAAPGSDIDLGLLFDKPLSGSDKLGMIEAIGAEFGRPVDIVDLFHAPEPVTGQVFKGKRLLGDDTRLCRTVDETPGQYGRFSSPSGENTGGEANRMDRVVVAEKLESLRRCIQRIQEKTPPEIGSLICRTGSAGHPGTQSDPSGSTLC